jgi:radical SAM protein with 4Fe4S-binding SPASM domain
MPITHIEHLASHHTDSITLTGGEPLLSNHIVCAVNSFYKTTKKMRVNSNITLLTDSIAEQIAGKTTFQVSLISCDETIYEKTTQTAGNYKKMLQGISVLNKYHIPFNGNIVVSQLNIDSIAETVKMAEQLGATSISVTRMCNTPHTDLSTIKPSNDEFVTAFSTAKEATILPVITNEVIPQCVMKNQSSCSFYSNMHLYVDIYGNTRGCGHMNNNLGNILNVDADELLKRARNYKKIIPEKCLKCNEYNSFRCDTGCYANRLYGGDSDVFV